MNAPFDGVSQVEEGAGRFPHVSGMAYRFDASKSPGERIAEVTIAGAPLDPTRAYRLATNDFLGRGDDGYDMFARAPRLIDENAARLQVAQVIEAITAAGTIAPRSEGRITRLDSPTDGCGCVIRQVGVRFASVAREFWLVGYTIGLLSDAFEAGTGAVGGTK